MMEGISESPFASVLPEDLAAICAVRGFQILRKYLQNDLSNSFCVRHTSIEPGKKLDYILHRDILHAMIMPVVQLFKRACALAYAALCTRKQEDLELAFRGEARDVFIWLQCFVSEEEGWCHTTGCPACVVTHTLSTESTIRATVAAALLSASDSTSSPSSPSSPSTESEGSDYDASGPSPTLPDFLFTLPALQRSVDDDPFWGPSFYSHILGRAERLVSGVQELISQCSTLEVLASSQPGSPVRPNLRRVVTINVVPSQAELSDGVNGEPGGRGKEINLKKSKMARRQSRLKHEEREMMMRMAWDAWSVAQGAGAARLAARQAARRGRGERRRTFTCP